MQKSRSLSPLKITTYKYLNNKKITPQLWPGKKGGGELSMHASVFPPNVGHSTSTFGGVDLVDDGFRGKGTQDR